MINAPRPPLLRHFSSTRRPLSEAVVDVWRVRLDRPLPHAAHWISPAERARAERFHKHEDCRQWIACRASLRRILSKYMGIDPRDVSFSRLRQGKPVLAGSVHILERQSRRLHGRCGDLTFNLSHTQGLALIAVANGNFVGIDVERIHHSLDALELAPAVLARDEAAQVLHAAPAARAGKFLQLWTRKEAWVKMLGCGLNEELQARSLVDTQDIPAHLRPAHILKINVGPHYRGSLSIEKPVSCVRVLDYTHTAGS